MHLLTANLQATRLQCLFLPERQAREVWETSIKASLFWDMGGGSRKKIVIFLVFNYLNSLYELSVQEVLMKKKDVLSVFFLSLHIHTCVRNLHTSI